MFVLCRESFFGTCAVTIPIAWRLAARPQNLAAVERHENGFPWRMELRRDSPVQHDSG